MKKRDWAILVPATIVLLSATVAQAQPPMVDGALDFAVDLRNLPAQGGETSPTVYIISGTGDLPTIAGPVIVIDRRTLPPPRKLGCSNPRRGGPNWYFNGARRICY